MTALAACSDGIGSPVAEGVGPHPQLPAAQHDLLPTVHVAAAIGWPATGKPRAASGLQVHAFARGLDHPRWLLVLPNGDVLVAETNAPARPDDRQGLRGWVMTRLMRKAGATVVSANRITLLRDVDGDGVADMSSLLLGGLNSPFGMALIGANLYVANTDAVMRFPYRSGDLNIRQPGVRVIDLPAGPTNHHWTKNLIASPDGGSLYVSIGSNSNAAESGMASETGRAAIWKIDLHSGEHRVFATGLRNPNGMAWEASRGALWTVVNERDERGPNLVPDYLTSVQDGGFYGWPFSYFGRNVDALVQPANPAAVARALEPDYALGAHTASLGLASSVGSHLPAPWVDGMFIGQHGSWNRRPFSGYKVIHVPFAGGRPSGPPVDVLGGFLSDDGKAYGRPVGVALDHGGALLVADDVGNTVWRVTAAVRAPAATSAAKARGVAP